MSKENPDKKGRPALSILERILRRKSEMTPQEEIDELEAEVASLIDDEHYQPVREGLEDIQSLVGAMRGGDDLISPAELKELLEQVKNVNREAKHSSEPVDTAQEFVARHIQSKEQDVRNLLRSEQDINVAGGDVNKAGRDVNKAEIILQIHNLVLTHAAQAIKKEAPFIYAPVVLLVMTRREARQLTDAAVFQDYNDEIYYRQFTELMAALPPGARAHALEGYGDTPEAWQPFAEEPTTIGELIRVGLSEVTGFGKPLEPKFVDLREMTREVEEDLFQRRERRKKLSKLRKHCLVIMDVVSMYHPTIQRAYRRSLIDAYPHIPVVKLGPAGVDANVAHQMLRFQEQFKQTEIYYRLKLDTDSNCEEAYDEAGITRWLKRSVEFAVDESDMMNQQDNAQQVAKRATGAVR